MDMIDYELRPGDLIFNNWQVERLPVGSKVIVNGDVQTKRGMPNRFSRSLDDSERYWWTVNGDVNGGVSLIAYPDDYEYELEPLSRFQWKVRDVTRVAGKRHSVSGVPETLRELGITDDKYPVGVGMRVLDRSILDSTRYLPVESVVSYSSPEDPAFTVCRRTPDGWDLMYGPRTGMQGWATVEEVGGVVVEQDWLDPALNPTTPADLARFKAKVWTTGQANRGRYSWCGVATQVMNTLGINERCLYEARTLGEEARPVVGTRVGPDVQQRLPLGTLLSHSTDMGRTYWYVSSITGAHPNGTERVACWEASEHPADNPRGHGTTTAVVLGYPGDWMEVHAAFPLRWVQGLSPNWWFSLDSTHEERYRRHNYRLLRRASDNERVYIADVLEGRSTLWVRIPEAQ